MIFTSLDFSIYLPIVFLVFWMLPKTGKSRNLFILIASYYFYAAWDWRFLGLIVFSTLSDFVIGNQIKGTKRKDQLFLALSLFTNLSLLFYFKYCNFFIEGFVDTFAFFGNTFTVDRLDIILPVGISFYTFQTLSYTIDIYRKKIEPEYNFLQFAAFVSFFPQLVAGPIERASNLLPQFKGEKKFHYYNNGISGVKQILWGVFKKIVIADNCAEIVNEIFSQHDVLSGWVILYGAILFSFQIYGDFSGYSDIAIGTARLFGFNLMQNFNFPYFSRDIAEFWRRWHISLSTWFRDYLYIPLGGSQVNTFKKIRNIFIIFVVSGIWHGANWNFIFWGAINAALFLPLLLLKRNRSNLGNNPKHKLLPSFKELISIVFTFFLVTFCWIFFRADTLSDAFQMVWKICLDMPSKNSIIELLNNLHWKYGYVVPNLLIIFVLIEWQGRFGTHALEKFLSRKSMFIRRSFYGVLIILISLYMQTEQSPFIYFDF